MSLSKKVGFIGLGIMGKPMAYNLRKAGYQLVVFDINPEPVKELVVNGAIKGSSAADVAQQVDVVILMLPDSPQVEEVTLADDGVLAGARTGLPSLGSTKNWQRSRLGQKTNTLLSWFFQTWFGISRLT